MDTLLSRTWCEKERRRCSLEIWVAYVILGLFLLAIDRFFLVPPAFNLPGTTDKIELAGNFAIVSIVVRRSDDLVKVFVLIFSLSLSLSLSDSF